MFTPRSDTFRRIPTFEGKEILSIGTGASHAFCLTTEGLFGWGRNHIGQVSQTMENCIYPPKRIDFFDQNVYDISIGGMDLDPYRYNRLLFVLCCREHLEDNDENLFGKFSFPLDIVKILHNMRYF